MNRIGLRTLWITIGLAGFAAIAGQWVGRQTLERRYREAVGARRQLELELAGLRADRDQLAQAIGTERERSAQLAAALATKDEELERVVSRLNEEGRVVQELQGKLLAIQFQFDRLQSELAVSLHANDATAADGQGRAVQLQKVVVTQGSSDAVAVSLEGRVLSVNPEWRFVVIDLGWDKVNIGDVVAIYRENALLGKARVERVQEEVSAASLLPEWVEAEVQVNDVVKSL